MTLWSCDNCLSVESVQPVHKYVSNAIIVVAPRQETNLGLYYIQCLRKDFLPRFKDDLESINDWFGVFNREIYPSLLWL